MFLLGCCQAMNYQRSITMDYIPMPYGQMVYHHLHHWLLRDLCLWWVDVMTCFMRPMVPCTRFLLHDSLSCSLPPPRSRPKSRRGGKMRSERLHLMGNSQALQWRAESTCNPRTSYWHLGIAHLPALCTYRLQPNSSVACEFWGGSLIGASPYCCCTILRNSGDADALLDGCFQNLILVHFNLQWSKSLNQNN